MIRRDALTALAASAGSLLTEPTQALPTSPTALPPAFVPCLNMSTIRGRSWGLWVNWKRLQKRAFAPLKSGLTRFRNT
ncbi:hypothetical protein [Spirosoma rhododendri]|uniref:Uncharacterized protein n=1 Tax=Spirosoma rhododendri TaxID=2728024 RepID=A0A7L5DKL4_9BACT|nr:hypothetical protein HH216_06130 [Spirosoma rhododendri]